MALSFLFSLMCPVLKLFYLKNIFILLFWFPLFGQHSFLSKEGSRKAMFYMSDGIKNNSLYSAAAMHEHAILMNRVRVRVNNS